MGKSVGFFGQHTFLKNLKSFQLPVSNISRTGPQSVIENIPRICLSCMENTKYAIDITTKTS